MALRKAIDISGMDSSVFDSLSEKDKLDSRGIAGDKLLEPIPEFISLKNEKVIKGENNSWIVLGRDRPGSRISGYGGKGMTQAGSIDIVVGRMSPKPMATSPANGKPILVDPMFKDYADALVGPTMDAARILISQKTDVDENFGLVAGHIGSPMEGQNPRSAVAIKADGVRVIAREGIKLVTGVGKYNSIGGFIGSTVGVDIIAGNDDKDLQPMVKGKSLVEGLEEMSRLVDDLSGIVDAFLMSQMEINMALMTHFHPSPFFAAPTLHSPILQAVTTKALMDQVSRVKVSLLGGKANIARFKLDYLKPFGEKYINSKFNNVN
jgi:hypothetical protein